MDTADSISWSDKMFPAPDQGSCGSDWAFSVTGAVEGANTVYTNQMVKLSEQQLVDCVGHSCSCKGCTFSFAYEYLEENWAERSSDYPYSAGNIGERDCKYDESLAEQTGIKVKTYHTAESGDIDMIKQALSHQPVSASMFVGKEFQLYSSGIYDNDSCQGDSNFSVVLAGYGTTDEGMDYWLARNSWSTAWGEEGYFRIAIKPGNGICDIQTNVTWPTLI